MLVAVSIPSPRTDFHTLRAERRLSRTHSHIPTYALPARPQSPTLEAEASRSRAGKSFKTTWKSLVQFFALSLRDYHPEPPSLTFSQQHQHEDDEVLQPRQERPRPVPYHEIDITIADYDATPPCPLYESAVPADEMILCRAQVDQPNPPITMLTVHESQHEQTVDQPPSQPQPLSQTEQSDTVQEIPSPALESNPSHVPRSIGLSRSISTHHRPRSRPRSPFSWRPNPRVRSLSVFGLSSSTSQSSQPIIPASELALEPEPESESEPTPPWTAAAATAAATELISDPLNWAEMRSLYPYPKQGLTYDQQRFLNSFELLAKYNVPFTPPSTSVIPNNST